MRCRPCLPGISFIPQQNRTDAFMAGSPKTKPAVKRAARAGTSSDTLTGELFDGAAVVESRPATAVLPSNEDVENGGTPATSGGDDSRSIADSGADRRNCGNAGDDGGGSGRGGGNDDGNGDEGGGDGSLP